MIFKIKQIGNWILWTVILANTLQGCAPMVVGGAGALVTTAAEERGLGGVWDDSSIKTKILWYYGKEKNGMVHQIDVVVRQGRVLLTGTVSTPQIKLAAVRLAWKVKGVVEVMDELKIGNEASFATYTTDSWITTKVKAALLFDRDVNSLNYNIQTIKGVVYLMGVAANEHDCRHAVERARRVTGVKEVVNYIEIGKKYPTPKAANPNA